MNGPNKIYIHRKDLSYSEIKESDSDIEFIRKDALLEKLETQNADKRIINGLISIIESL